MYKGTFFFSLIVNRNAYLSSSEDFFSCTYQLYIIGVWLFSCGEKITWDILWLCPQLNSQNLSAAPSLYPSKLTAVWPPPLPLLHSLLHFFSLLHTHTNTHLHSILAPCVCMSLAWFPQQPPEKHCVNLSQLTDQIWCWSIFKKL